MALQEMSPEAYMRLLFEVYSNAFKLAKRFRQLLDDAAKRMTGERSARDMSSLAEGEACLPRQTHTQPRNGKQMNRMMVTRTVSLPMAVGGD